MAQKRKNYRGKHASARKAEPVNVVLVCVLATVLLLAVLLAAWLLITKPWEGTGTIYPNISAGGVDLSGLTRREAEDALQSVAAAYSRESMVIQVGGETIELDPAAAGVKLDVAAVAREAWEYGRRGTEAQQTQEQEQARLEGYEVELTDHLGLDMTAIQRAVDMLGAEFETRTEWHLEGERPSLALDQPAGEDQTLVITLGTEFGLDTTALMQKILDAYNEGRFLVEISQEELGETSVNLDAIYQETYVAPVDAQVDPKTFQVLSDGTYGYGFDLDAAREQLSSAQPGDVLRIPLTRIDPEITAANLQDSLFQDELAACQSEYDPTDTDRSENLRLACEAIDGLVLNPGDVFSYNETLGQRTEEKGYRPGDAYVGGETVKTIGGGICQVSSTLYYCTMVADLEIVERDCHMYAPTYVPLGMDATINWGTIDFKFRNSTNYPLRIEAKLEDDQVCVRLLGTDEKDYYVELEYEILSTTDYQTVYQEMEFGNEKHYVDGDVIVTPYTGYDVQTYRCKYDKATGQLLSREEESFSRYDPRDEVVCKIVMDIPDDLYTGGGVGAGGNG